MAKNFLSESGLSHLISVIKQAIADMGATKVDKVTAKGLSTNDYTTDDKTKLTGISAGAEVNVNADWNSISGDSQILNKPNLDFLPLTGGALSGDLNMSSHKVTNVDAGIASTDAINLGQLNNAIAGLGTVFNIKGVKATVAELPTTGNTEGDVWFVEENSSGWIWLNKGTAEVPSYSWEEFGPDIDLSGYLQIINLAGTTGSSTQTAMTQAATTTALNTLSATTTAALAGKLDTNGTAVNSDKLDNYHATDFVLANGTDSLMTAAERSKLLGIESGAQVNVNANWSSVSGDSQILNKPTTLSGYGITDAKIVSGTVTLGSNTITPVVDVNYVHTDNNYAAADKAIVDSVTANLATKQDTVVWKNNDYNSTTNKAITNNDLLAGLATLVNSLQYMGVVPHVGSNTMQQDIDAYATAQSITWKIGSTIQWQNNLYMATSTLGDWIPFLQTSSFAVKGAIVNNDIAANAAIATSKISGIDSYANKIETIQLNGTTQTITNKNVNLQPVIADVSGLATSLASKINGNSQIVSMGYDDNGFYIEYN